MRTKFRIPEIIPGSLLTIAVFAIGVAFDSSRHPPSTQSSGAHEGADVGQKDRPLWVPTDAVGLYTLVLALVSCFQGVMLLRADETARIAADAATLNAKIAVALQSPIIRGEAQKLGYAAYQEKAEQRHCIRVHELSLRNAGATKAIPAEIQIGCTIADRLPNAPVYRFVKPFPIDTILLPNGSVSVSLTEFDFEAPQDIYNLVRTGSTKLWFYCNFVYFDFLQVRHEAGFCWRCHETTGMGTLIPDPAPAYNLKT